MFPFRLLGYQSTTLERLPRVPVGGRKDFEVEIAQQQKQIEALTAGLQKVTARVESGNSGPRIARDN
jgi:hypothetical protein